VVPRIEGLDRMAACLAEACPDLKILSAHAA